MTRPEWTVTVVCGASGVGKSSVARPLAARFGVPLIETDDIVTALTALTTPATHPVLHRWHSDDTARTWEPERIVEHALAVAAALAPGLRAVIADHVEFRAPAVIEGDHLTPDIVTGLHGARAVVVAEPDEDRIVENLLRREPDAGEQRIRARVSALHGDRLAEIAARAGVPVVPSRPFGDVLDRVERALRT
jgi:2-phosphoglycerate kinase